MNQKPKPAIKLGVIGSTIFGVILFFIGYAFKHFLHDGGIITGRDGTICLIAGVIAMIIGAVITVINICWMAFIIYLYFTED